MELGEQVRILYSEGSHLYKKSMQGGALEGDRLIEAFAVAQRSDVVILCLGLDAHIEGEAGDASNEYGSGDKTDLSLPYTQQALLDMVLKAGKPVVVCVMAGSALDLSKAQNDADAVLQMWYPGALGGSAAADILFGHRSPSGKLPVTFYKSLEGLPDFEDYSMEGRTYRYMKDKALYPFGYGLNYGDIICADAFLERETEEEIVLHAIVKNQGKRETPDVLQIYVKNMESSLAVPNFSLCGIKPFSLKPEEERDIMLPISKKMLEVVNWEGKRIIDGKQYVFYVGFSQPDERSRELTGKSPLEIYYTYKENVEVKMQYDILYTEE